MAKFKKGNPGGPGRTPGSGRNQFCKEWAEKKGLAFLARIAEGKEQQIIGLDKITGKPIKAPPEYKTRVFAATYLCDQGLGKAPQAVEHSGHDGDPLKITVEHVYKKPADA